MYAAKTTHAASIWRPHARNTPVDTAPKASNKAYTASTIMRRDARRVTSSSSVKIWVQKLRPKKTATAMRGGDDGDHFVRDAHRVRRAVRASHSDFVRHARQHGYAQSDRDAVDESVRHADTPTSAANATSGFGSHPANTLTKSLAHHSAFTKTPGIPNRKNSTMPVGLNASFALHPGQHASRFAATASSPSLNTRLHTVEYAICTPSEMLSDTLHAYAAPSTPIPSQWMKRTLSRG